MLSKSFDAFTFKNGMHLKNRIFMAPMTTSSSTAEGNVTDEELIYYLVRSTGPSAVITACAYISSEGQAFENGMGISKDDHIKSLRKVAQTIQLQGAKAVCQIYHGGRMAQQSFNGGRQPISPSAIKAERSWTETPKALTNASIHILIKQFGQAVKRAIDAGFDGVELHGANTYLLQQFLSPHSNRRTDEWGGSLENRMSFPLEVVKECQKVINQYATKPFLLGYRLSPEEIENPGIRLDDTLLFINQLIKHNIDYLHLSVQHYYQPSLVSFRNYHQQVPKTIAEHIDNRVPYINVGNIHTPKHAEEALEYSDFVSLGRQLLVEPKWVEKVEEGLENKISTKLDPTNKTKYHIPDKLWNQIVSGWFDIPFIHQL